MADVLAKVGLYFDESNRIRVLEPEASAQTAELTNQCAKFIEATLEFKTIVDNFISIIDRLTGDVENAKIKALGSRNSLKSFAKERETQRQQLKSLILEKRQEMERLKIYHQSLVRVESEQLDLMEFLNHQK